MHERRGLLVSEPVSELVSEPVFEPVFDAWYLMHGTGATKSGADLCLKVVRLSSILLYEVATQTK